ncbi:MAG: ABC transporter ATP-binding protein [Promethearchaeota archaeon]
MAHGGRGRGPPMISGVMADKEKTRPTRQLLGILWNYLGKFRDQLVVISIIIVLATIANTITPIIIGNALDRVAANTNMNIINSIIILFLLLSLSVWIFESLNKWFTAEVRSRFIHVIRLDVFNHLINADMSYHHTEQSGNVTSRAVNDTEELATGIAVVTNASSQFLLIISTFIVLFYLNWAFAVISLLSIPVAMIITGIIGTIGKRTMLRVRSAYGRVSGKLAEALAGVAISKTFNREEWTSQEIQELNNENYGYMKQLGVIFMLIMPSVSMISTFLVALTLLFGGFLLSEGSSLTIGSIYLGVILVQRFLRPVIHLANYFTQLQASLAAMDRITDVLEAQPAISDQPNAVPLDISDPSITFENLTFSYVPGIKVLENLSIKINSGEKVAIVGHTGAGKTTITALLMRFYDPDSGSILIGNQDIKAVTLDSIHSNLSLIPQEPYLFADTVLENIRYGRPEATDEEVYELCHLIGVDRFVEILPQDYETILFDSGKSLSAGQRQMITIARTMLSDPKILILDEATSRLDAYSESLVQIAQNKLFEGRTTIVIAHRLSTIRDVDRILVLEKGHLVEFGTPDELMEKQGVYYEIYKTYYAHQGTETAEVVLGDIQIKEEV